MKIGCYCGNTIHDTTDNLYYAAYSIADKDLDSFQDAFVAETLSGAPQALETWSRAYQNKFYQCPECHRLYFDSADKKSLIVFAPEDKTSAMVTDSIFGDKCKYTLAARWSEKSEWIPANGLIMYGSAHNSHCDEYLDFQEMEQEYYRLFEELRSKGSIHSAVLWSGDTTFHKWLEPTKFSLEAGTTRKPVKTDWGMHEYPDYRIGSPSIVDTVQGLAERFHIPEEEAAHRFFSGDVLELWKQKQSRSGSTDIS